MSRGWAGGSSPAWRRRRAEALAYYPPICCICGQAIDLDLPGTHPHGPSVDHLIPRAHGGTDDLPNLRPAHLGCNASRGARHRTQEPATSRNW